MTLVELLGVLGVIGLILGMSVPGLAGYAQRVRLKAALRQVVGLVSTARSLAIGSRDPHAVIVDAEGRTLRVVNLVSGEALEQVVRLPSSVTVTLEMVGEPVTQTQIVFRPTGALEGRSVSLVLEDRGRRHVVAVAATTGAVLLVE